jgi:hypothetical protein
VSVIDPLIEARISPVAVLSLERLLRLVEQARVLDRDDSLPGERPKKRDLFGGEATWVPVRDDDRADGSTVPQQRDGEL